MKKVIALSCLLLLITGSWAQQRQQVSIGHAEIITSKILNEDRQIWIYMPASTNNSKEKFPVMYLLDGEIYFHSATAIVNHLSQLNGNAIIPDMIVVGIVNTNRHLDLTPSKDSTSSTKPNGGGEQFLKFIEQELKPYMHKNYPCAAHSILAGHSLGGLTSINCLLNKPTLFDAYIAIDPALWWNNFKLNKSATELLKNKALDKKMLYMGIANSFPKEMDEITAFKDTSSATIGYRSIIQFQELLESSKSKLVWNTKYYPNDGHGSVPMIALYDGLRDIYKFYKRPSFAKLSDDSPSILDKHYKQVSSKMGYTIFPPEETLVGLAWRCRQLDKDYHRAQLFLNLCRKYYPTSIGYYEELVQLNLDQGQQKKAEKNYMRLQEILQKQKLQ